ncbi:MULTISPECIES: hypothetical protein, partial [Pirellulaceae]|uniref:hypothetical protein n=1 Tax=Pirellulaceae TaxID=2691357 RepID=UPI001BE03CF6
LQGFNDLFGTTSFTLLGHGSLLGRNWPLDSHNTWTSFWGACQNDEHFLWGYRQDLFNPAIGNKEKYEYERQHLHIVTDEFNHATRCVLSVCKAIEDIDVELGQRNASPCIREFYFHRGIPREAVVAMARSLG